MGAAMVWVDRARCTGCGVCIERCPAGALALAEGKASVDEDACTGCGVCVDACPEGALVRVVEGELVPVPERPAPVAYRPGPLVRSAAPALAVTGVGLLAQAGRALVRAAGRWLQRQPVASQSAAGRHPSDKGPSRPGRRARHRRRGR